MVRNVRGLSPHKFSFAPSPSPPCPPAPPPMPDSSELPCKRVRYLSPQLKYIIFHVQSLVRFVRVYATSTCACCRVFGIPVKRTYKREPFYVDSLIKVDKSYRTFNENVMMASSRYNVCFHISAKL